MDSATDALETFYRIYDRDRWNIETYRMEISCMFRRLNQIHASPLKEFWLTNSHRLFSLQRITVYLMVLAVLTAIFNLANRS
ncbi:hypothetical protein [Thalassospira lucentensis]|uniref:hypothetical protein n=1 Tax=Thalassospira lucentensis TaxID=168935 RepID=UPI0029431B64|nr:hypothetical protein [Thalassospira lucentensis]WOI08947.1 hypothetical protein R1T41_00530 [Thalassospira lucentensis]